MEGKRGRTRAVIGPQVPQIMGEALVVRAIDLLTLALRAKGAGWYTKVALCGEPMLFCLVGSECVSVNLIASSISGMHTKHSIPR